MALVDRQVLVAEVVVHDLLTVLRCLRSVSTCVRHAHRAVVTTWRQIIAGEIITRRRNQIETCDCAVTLADVRVLKLHASVALAFESEAADGRPLAHVCIVSL